MELGHLSLGLAGKSLVMTTQVGQLGRMTEAFTRLEKLTPGADRLRSKILGLRGLPKFGRWGVAVSGGRDSMSLLAMLAELRQRTRWPADLELEVWHVHHGEHATSAEVLEFRDRAEALVEKSAQQYGLGFRSFRVQPTRESEEAWREARWAALASQASPVWLAHHRDDLLETRWMRLMRGTGPHGLKAMSVWDETRQIARPVLEWTPEELHESGVASAKVFSQDAMPLAFIDDPQNLSGGDLRARLRQEIWPRLETLRPGAKAAMARSLDLIVEMLDDSLGEAQCRDAEGQVVPQLQTANLLSRSRLMLISAAQAERSLHAWLRQRGHSASRAQIGEVLKRLARAEVCFEFDVAGLRWQVNGDELRASPYGAVPSRPKVEA
jgi:tRNA(Ile)-lysidine synthase